MDFGMPTLLELPTLRENAALCAKLGLRFVEINMNFPQFQPQMMDVKEVMALRSEYRVYFTVHLEEAFDPCAFNPVIREAYLTAAKQSAEFAAAIGAPVINFHLNRGIFITLPDERVYMFERFSSHYENCMRTFAAIFRKGAGIKFCVENTDGFAPFEMRMIEALLEEPCFFLTLDVGHSYAALDMDEPYYLKHKDRLTHMHLHDAKGKHNHLALGDGEIDLHARLALARECGCRIVIETKTVEALQKSVAWLHEAYTL
jgi:sugar phosphate isomerase/epimerase